MAANEGLKSSRTTADDRAELYLLRAKAHRQLREPVPALEAFLDSFQVGSSRAKPAAIEGIEEMCAQLGPPPREGDERRYKAVSWPRDDRTGNLRDTPSTDSSKSQILIILPRPTCVLVGPPRTTSPGEVWYPVETRFQGAVWQGWMHQVVLSP